MRCIEDVRGDLMRPRHRLGKFLLRRRERDPGPGGSWPAKHMGWLRSREFTDRCSEATFVDYLSAVELLEARGGTLIGALEQATPPAGRPR